MTPAQFLRALWGPQPPGHIHLWALDTKRSWWPRDPQAANTLAASHPVDLYCGVSLAHQDHGPRQRLTANQAVAIPGMWLDIDVDGTPDGRGGTKTGAAPDFTAACELAARHAQPTLLVDSGGGVHAWWLLTAPWRFASREEQQHAGQLAAKWQQLHRQDAGFAVDATHDLARLMRLPGTGNGKSTPPRPVTVVGSDGPRWTVEQLIALCAGVVADSDHAARVGDVHIQAGVPLDQGMVDQLCARSGRFARVWAHEDAGKKSLNERDLALCSIAHHMGLTDQQMAGLIVAHRRAHGDPQGKSGRPDYLQRTIAKARQQRSPETDTRVPDSPDPETGTKGGTLDAKQWADVILTGLQASDDDVIPMPFAELSDALDGGLRPGEVCLICGYTSAGKSLLVDQVLDKAADTGRTVHIYMTEMTAYARGLRVVARRGRVPFQTLKRRNLTDREWGKAIKALEQLPYGCSIVSDWTVDDVVAHIRENRWDLAVVDLIHGFHYRDERDLSQTSSALVRAAKGGTASGHKGTTIVAAAHLNDGQMRDQRSPQRPKPGLHSIKGSSSLKQDADVVMFVWQKDDEHGRPTGDGAVWVAKNRDGGLGDPAMVSLDPAWMEFVASDWNQHVDDDSDDEGMGF